MRTNLAGVLNSLHGGAVELLGVAKVGDDEVFAQLLADTGNTHLQVVSDPTPDADLRGIEVSLAYDYRKPRVVEWESFTTSGVSAQIVLADFSPPVVAAPASTHRSRRHPASRPA